MVEAGVFNVNLVYIVAQACSMLIYLKEPQLLESISGMGG